MDGGAEVDVVDVEGRIAAVWRGEEVRITTVGAQEGARLVVAYG